MWKFPAESQKFSSGVQRKVKPRVILLHKSKKKKLCNEFIDFAKVCEKLRGAGQNFWKNVLFVAGRQASMKQGAGRLQCYWREVGTVIGTNLGEQSRLCDGGESRRVKASGSTLLMKFVVWGW